MVPSAVIKKRTHITDDDRRHRQTTACKTILAH